MDPYTDSLMSVAKLESASCEICILRIPEVAEEDDQNDDSGLLSQFPQASFGGLFVQYDKNQHRQTYVDVVQKHVQPTVSERKPELSPYHNLGARKVSNASTVSTQADDEWWPDVQEPERQRVLGTASKENYHADDNTSVVSDWETSDLSWSTKERRTRMETRKKDIKGKKSEIGLLAVVPCPREEPDRSIPHLIFSNFQNC
jgi:hypothetical protein